MPAGYCTTLLYLEKSMLRINSRRNARWLLRPTTELSCVGCNNRRALHHRQCVARKLLRHTAELSYVGCNNRRALHHFTLSTTIDASN